MSSGAPVEHGTTIKYPSTALLCVNSENAEKYNVDGFRIDNTTPADIYINKQSPLMFGYMTRIALTEMNVQWGFPNVYSDTRSSNNTLTLSVWNSSGVFVAYTRITIPSGFYAAGQLGKAIQNALNANATLTATLGSNTFTVLVGGLETVASTVGNGGKTVRAADSNFTITTSGTGFFQIMPFSKALPGFPALQDDLTNMTGLTPAVLPGLPYYKTITGGYASMLRTPYIDVVSNLLTKNQNVKDSDTTKISRDSLLARIYLANEEAVQREITITYDSASPYSSIAFTDNAFGVRETAFRREFKFPKQIQWNSTENIDALDLRVLDHRGNVLNYQPTITTPSATVVQQANTADLQFTLQITEV